MTSNEIITELGEIKEQLDRIEILCDKMSKHVDFVDAVYERVKSPFEWFMNKIRAVSGIGGCSIQMQNMKKLK